MNKKKILFRADGNSKTGLGHLYRLFALVEIYKEKFEFIFLTKEASVLNIIPKDYNLKTIPNNIDINQEPYWISKHFSSNEYIIISDGYQFVSSYQKAITELGYFLMYIDDLTEEYMYANIVVNHSPNANIKNYKTEPYTNFALGTDYAILRPHFLNSAKSKKTITNIDTAFVCYGGADYFDFTLQTVQALLKTLKIKEINVVIGGAYKHTEIQKVAEQFSKVKLYRNLNEKDLNTLIEACNISFVSSSTILYEVMTVKMPVFTGFFVQNQIDFYRGIEKREVFFGMEDLRDFNFNTIPEKIEELTQEKIQEQIKNQKLIIDGEQKKRFLALI
ncbi:UDP-2,4-diacetamido-2,4,6-trideoxy-beta-L-altropyranose hydrolase [Algibacter sp. PT7-4]|uniref:UDP-2,4-diacetamido-2,4, 6-trideoxy-beta-L-altropyranose hydrolase n=1 Tax=Algibacter ulvanivorans TaxID=3400999 RepID=UPI003AAB63D0